MAGSGDRSIAINGKTDKALALIRFFVEIKKDQKDQNVL